MGLRDPRAGGHSLTPRQLASRARRRVRGATPARHPIVPGSARSSTPGSRSHAAVTSLGWLRLLHPDAVLRVDTGGTGSKLVRGAAEVARQATMYRAARLGGGPRWSRRPRYHIHDRRSANGGVGVHGRGRAGRRDRHSGRLATADGLGLRALIAILVALAAADMG